MRSTLLFAVIGSSAALPAQTTWIVNASGGPGVHFSDLAPAVAAAADGDTIVCQHPTFGDSLNGFTTNKELTIVGDANGVPLTTLVVPIQIVGLPAGKRFRMAGFQAIIDGELRIGVQNCAGEVTFDNLQARQPDFGFPTTPAIDIAQQRVGGAARRRRLRDPRRPHRQQPRRAQWLLARHHQVQRRRRAVPVGDRRDGRHRAAAVPDRWLSAIAEQQPCGDPRHQPRAASRGGRLGLGVRRATKQCDGRQRNPRHRRPAGAIRRWCWPPAQASRWWVAPAPWSCSRCRRRGCRTP
jgi:hypothetical protein